MRLIRTMIGLPLIGFAFAIGYLGTLILPDDATARLIDGKTRTR